MAHGTKKVRRALVEAGKAAMEELGGEWLGLEDVRSSGHLALRFKVDGHEFRHVAGGNDRHAEQSIKRMTIAAIRKQVETWRARKPSPA